VVSWGLKVWRAVGVEVEGLDDLFGSAQERCGSR